MGGETGIFPRPRAYMGSARSNISIYFFIFLHISEAAFALLVFLEYNFDTNCIFYFQMRKLCLKLAKRKENSFLLMKII